MQISPTNPPRTPPTIAPILGELLSLSCWVVFGTWVDTIVVKTLPPDVTVALVGTIWPFANVVEVGVKKVVPGAVEVNRTLDEVKSVSDGDGAVGELVGA